MKDKTIEMLDRLIVNGELKRCAVMHTDIYYSSEECPLCLERHNSFLKEINNNFMPAIGLF